MNLSGSARTSVSPEVAFGRLLDVDVLRQCIPGCQSLEMTSATTYHAVVKAGVGPVKGTFEGDVEVTEAVPAERCKLQIKGKSKVGFVIGTACLELTPDGEGCRIEYTSLLKISGLIASVGARLLGSSSKKLVSKFFEDLAAQVVD